MDSNSKVKSSSKGPCFNLVCFIFLSILTCYIIIDLFVAKQLYNASTYIAIYLQSNKSLVLQWFFYLISYLIGEFGQGIQLFLPFLLASDKINILKLIIYICFCINSNAILKMIQIEARPFFIIKEIEGKACEVDFGRPSGHSHGGMLLLLLVWYQWKYSKFSVSSKFVLRPKNSIIPDNEKLIESNNFEIQEEVITENRKMGFNIALPFIILLVFTIGLSRIQFGVHSLNQILLGFSYGLLEFLLFIWFFEDLLQQQLERITQKSSEFEAKKDLMLTIIVFICWFFIGFVPFLLNNFYFVMPDTWKESITTQCPNSHNLLFNKDLTDFILMATAFFGLLIGIVLTKGQYKPEQFEVNYWNLPWWRKIVRILWLGVIGGATAGILVAIKLLKIDWLSYILQGMLIVVCAFLIIFLIPKLQKWTKVDVEGDLFRVLENNGNLESLEPQTEMAKITK